MVSRFTLLISSFVLAYLGLVSHLYTIQLTNGQVYRAKAESQYAANNLLSASRGSIYFTDKNNNRMSAASNKEFPLVYAVPKAIDDPSEAANILGPILDIPVKDLKARLAKADDAYELLMKKADAETVSKIEDFDLKGIYVENIPQRFYPLATLSSHALGFVAPNSTDNGASGKYGIEEFYNEKLSGVSGSMEGSKIVAPKPGEDVVLTIDPNIQIEASRLLGDLIKKWSAKGGSVIVQDPKTGKILAMDSFPHFDPNNYSVSPVGDFLNPVTQKIYEPGSVFKVLTMAAGIDAGKITPNTTYEDTGALVLNGRKIMNWDLEAHGRMTMTNVIEKSLNTGAAFAQRKMGEEIFTEYMVNFGFPEKTGIDLPGELKGDLKRLTPDAPEIAFATASFGQGVAVTPLQMINSINALANGGKLMRPYLNSDLGPKVIREVVKPSTAKQVAEMMVSAVDKAQVAHINGYGIAGKTGTAQVPDFKRGGYAEGKVVNTYIGFGPVADPRFTILFKLDEPQDAPLAGQTVVPAFRDLAQFLLNYYNIAPDRL